MSGPSAYRPARPMTTAAYPMEISTEDLTEIGRILVNAGATMTSLGHESPSGLAAYVAGEYLSWHAKFVLDMVSYSQGIVQNRQKNDALDRISGFAWQTGWMHRIADAMAPTP